MSNLDDAPPLVQSAGGPLRSADAPPEIIPAREVPLGGPRAMTVHRTLPSKRRTMIGAWCFVDHFGPMDVSLTGGMLVPSHPHTGLQTVSWMFDGEVEHRDSIGTHAFVRPGVLNLMTAGRGISHSEVSTPATKIVHGAQLWVALPEAHRDIDPFFESRESQTATVGDAEISVFLGEFVGRAVGATTFTAAMAAEIRIPAGGSALLPLEPDYEYGLLVDEGPAVVGGHPVERTELAFLATGRASVAVDAPDHAVRALLIGGVPLDEKILMWWNFIGRNHEEIVTYRAEWQHESGATEPDGSTPLVEPGEGRARRFGSSDHHYTGKPLPAPLMPPVRLQPRNR